MLVSSHNLRELEDVCDHVGIMDHGRVLLERSLAQLQDNMVKLQVVFPDGVTEVPQPVKMPGWGSGVTSDDGYRIDWYSYDSIP